MSRAPLPISRRALSALATRAAQRLRHARGARHAAAAVRPGAQVVVLPPRSYTALLQRLSADCRSVLDVGTGLMDSLAISPCPVKVGLDAHRPYLEHRRVQEAVPINADARMIADLFVPGAVDLVTLIDVIEHFPKEEALELLSHAEVVARRRVVLFTPSGFFPQEGHDAFGLGGEELQEHRSTWEPPELTSRGYRVAVLQGFHDARNESFVRAFGRSGRAVDALFAWKDVGPAANAP